MFITLQLVLKKVAMGEIWYRDRTQQLSATAKFVKNHIEDGADLQLILGAAYEVAIQEIVTVFELNHDSHLK
jgi:hypothetical protein